MLVFVERGNRRMNKMEIDRGMVKDKTTKKKGKNNSYWKTQLSDSICVNVMNSVFQTK